MFDQSIDGVETHVEKVTLKVLLGFWLGIALTSTSLWIIIAGGVQP